MTPSKIRDLAKQLGYEVRMSATTGNKFTFGDSNVWKCTDGWMFATCVKGTWGNHLKFKTAIGALIHGSDYYSILNIN